MNRRSKDDPEVHVIRSSIEVTGIISGLQLSGKESSFFPKYTMMTPLFDTSDTRFQPPQFKGVNNDLKKIRIIIVDTLKA